MLATGSDALPVTVIKAELACEKSDTIPYDLMQAGDPFRIMPGAESSLHLGPRLSNHSASGQNTHHKPLVLTFDASSEMSTKLRNR